MFNIGLYLDLGLVVGLWIGILAHFIYLDLSIGLLMIFFLNMGVLTGVYVLIGAVTYDKASKHIFLFY